MVVRAALFAISLGLGANAEPPSQTFMVTQPMATSDSTQIDYFYQQTAFTSSMLPNRDSHGHVNGHLLIVNNPRNRFAVVPPLPDGCGSVQYVNKTAHLHNPNCIFAMDAGYYNLHEDALFDCIGNVVSDGEIKNVEPLETSNVNFGILKNGSYVIGYISPEEVMKGEFQQLVAGLGWIVREGKNYVDQGWKEAYTAAGASGDEYVSMTSGRTAIGWTKEGKLIVLQYDGHTHEPSWGATMNELADKLISFGAVEAINLDGGGSTQMWKNGEQVGYSSDRAVWGILAGTYDPGCPIGNSNDNLSDFQCSRAVSTILCIHEDPFADTDHPVAKTPPYKPPPNGGPVQWGGAPVVAAVVVMAMVFAGGVGVGMLCRLKGRKHDEEEDDDDEE